MRLKTYRATTMADALVQVKKDLGKNAVILHTRAYKVGTILGFGGKPQVEVTATADINAISPKQLRERMTPREPANAVARAYAAPMSKPPVPTEPTIPAAKDVAQIALTPPTPTAPAPVVDEQLKTELAAIKRMVGQVLQQRPAAHPPTPMPPALVDQYMALIESEVARELADRIIGDIRDALSPAELADAVIVRAAVLRRIESMLPPADAAPPTKPADGRPATIALIGPTGVGKTTTLAKLAAAYKLRHAKRVGLITCDTYRIAAVDQLRTYANIIGLPLKVVLTPTEMEAACEELAGCDCILIDTAGRSPADAPRLDELRAMLDAAKPHQTHLVLSSVVGEGAMLKAAERFGDLKPDHLIFTKLDEAAGFGVLLNVAQRLDAKLAYLTTGQEVPDDIEPGRPDRLARIILDRSLTP